MVLKLDKVVDEDGLSSFSIGHTDSRVSELSTCIADILSKGSISSKEAERLRGRMQWFETCAFGRVANQPMRVLSKLASSKRFSLKLTEHDVSSSTFLKDRVLTAPPVRISRVSMNTVLIFTDGSCEGEDSLTGGVGGILINEWGVPHLVSRKECQATSWRILNNTVLTLFLNLKFCRCCVVFSLGTHIWLRNSVFSTWIMKLHKGLL